MNINTRTPRCPHCMEVQNGMTGFGIHVKYECKALGRDRDPEYPFGNTPAADRELVDA